MWQRCGCDVTAMQRGLCPGLEILLLKSPRQDEGVSCCVLGAMSSILVIRFGETIIGTICDKRSVVLWLAAALQRFRKSCHLTATSLCQDTIFSRMYRVLLYFYETIKFSANLVDEGWSKICCDASFCLSSICDLAIWPRCDGDLSQGLVCFLRFETCDASCDGIAAICDAMRADAKDLRVCPSSRFVNRGIRN